MDIPSAWTFKSSAIAANFGTHIREQLPWYELATDAVSYIVRNYCPRHGLVYDIGAATGNIGQAISPILNERAATLIALDDSEDMAKLYGGPGTVVVADAVTYQYEPFDVAICFLVLMFLSVEARHALLESLRRVARRGAIIIVVEKVVTTSSFVGIVMRRLTMHWKARNGVPPDEIIKKELSLCGVQRPLVVEELGSDACEFFRMGEFAGWIIEVPARCA